MKPAFKILILGAFSLAAMPAFASDIQGEFDKQVTHAHCVGMDQDNSNYQLDIVSGGQFGFLRAEFRIVSEIGPEYAKMVRVSSTDMIPEEVSYLDESGNFRLVIDTMNTVVARDGLRARAEFRFIDDGQVFSGNMLCSMPMQPKQKEKAPYHILPVGIDDDGIHQ
jgi:hypothetical protein